MTILQDLLPFMKGWKFNIVRPTNFTIPAGGAQVTYDSKARKSLMDGYVLGLGASADQPTTTLEIRHVGPSHQERLITGSPFSLNAGGFTVPNGSGFWCPVYNAVLGVYNAVFTPDSRVGFFNDFMRVRILAPAGAQAVVTGYYHTIVEVHDRKAWINSWRRLFQSNVFHVKGLKEVQSEK